ncbi:hypothetical protein BM1_00513 [Bipolaris maydis]|nr:hypothetical protein BM1_00513 [Bipolaris maydis]
MAYDQQQQQSRVDGNCDSVLCLSHKLRLGGSTPCGAEAREQAPSRIHDATTMPSAEELFPGKQR